MNDAARGAPRPAGHPRALIVALDGVVMHTAAARASAVRDACATLGVAADTAPGEDAMTGWTMSEVVERWWATRDDADPTRGTLLALAAERAQGQRLAAALAVRVDGAAVARVREALARGTRVVLRSDCARREAEALVAQSPLAGEPCTLVCADDRLATASEAGRGATAGSATAGSGTAGGATAARAWTTIDRRLQALGVAVAERVALEATHEVAVIAARHVAQVAVWTPSR